MIETNGTTRWGYYDYVRAGYAEGGRRAFQTLSKLDSSSARTAEEFHYAYDTAGRLLEATFAMSPSAASGAPTSAPFYTQAFPASSRARAQYTYDPGGRTLSVEHYRDASGGSSLSAEAVLANACTYENSGAKRGLRTQSDFYVKNPSSSAWLLERTETYGYDADLHRAVPLRRADASGNIQARRASQHVHRQPQCIGGMGHRLPVDDDQLWHSRELPGVRRAWQHGGDACQVRRLRGVQPPGVRRLGRDKAGDHEWRSIRKALRQPGARSRRRVWSCVHAREALRADEREVLIRGLIQA